MGQAAQLLHRSYHHVHLDEAGVAWIDGTTVKVLEIVLDRHTHGWSPEEVHFQHPDLSLAQIHGALVWYEGHQHEVDADIQRRLEETDAMRGKAPASPLRTRLRGRAVLVAKSSCSG